MVETKMVDVGYRRAISIERLVNGSRSVIPVTWDRTQRSPRLRKRKHVKY
jgi:hypothetical protein